MSALLSLFLGSRACALTKSELSRCVVRREHGALLDEIAIPTILPTEHREISDDPLIVQQLMDLPPPLPVRDGGLPGALIGRGLVHQWASSEAALREAMRRRIAKAAALTASLESGSYPTARELETWIYGDGSLQLGFPEILSSPTEDAGVLLESVRSHADALRAFHERHRTETTLDGERADILDEIRHSHPSAKIVAFAQYAETVSMLFRRVSGSGGVAMLAAQGGLVAGGKLTRREALARFAPLASREQSPPLAERIDLLLTTDLLSEGVNLQDAQIVVHLDVPWTAARMEQRVGRAARMGSLHRCVHVYVLRPPASAAAVLGSELTVQRKWSVAKRAIGTRVARPFGHRTRATECSESGTSIPEKAERLRAILEAWRGPMASSEVSVASVEAQHGGFVAAASINGKPILIAGMGDELSSDVDSLIAACLLCEGKEVEADLIEYQAAIAQIQNWVERQCASEVAGVAPSSPVRRKRLLNRIDSIIESAPPHLRASRSALALRARKVAAAQHGVSVERELDSLARSALPHDEWLDAIVALQSAETRAPEMRPQMQSLTIHALVMIRQRNH
jgi:hypothetical protein